MLRLATMTGGPANASVATSVLRRWGYEVVPLHTSCPGGRLAAVDPPRSSVDAPPATVLDCYLQLPGGLQPPRRQPARRGGVRDELCARIDLLALTAPSLSSEAAVVLALDETAPGPAALSADLLEAMARVVLEDAGRPDVRVSVLPVGALTTARRPPAGTPVADVRGPRPAEDEIELRSAVHTTT